MVKIYELILLLSAHLEGKYMGVGPEIASTRLFSAYFWVALFVFFFFLGGPPAWATRNYCNMYKAAYIHTELLHCSRKEMIFTYKERLQSFLRDYTIQLRCSQRSHVDSPLWPWMNLYTPASLICSTKVESGNRWALFPVSFQGGRGSKSIWNR